MRVVKVAAAQVGGIQAGDEKSATVVRLIKLLERAASQGVKLVVFPELTLTTFFPRSYISSGDELDSYFESSFPNSTVEPLFAAAQKNHVGFNIGFAEKESLHGKNTYYNTSVLVSPSGDILAKYRKTHLPGFDAPVEGKKWQQLEKLYFSPGNTGFKAVRTDDKQWISGIFGLLICNDRRWAEAWRCYGLQGVELVMCGYNTASTSELFNETKEQRLMQSSLVIRANSYMNACYAIGVAKCGVEDGQEMMGGSVIVDPRGNIVAEAQTEEDELVISELDLDLAKELKSGMFDMKRHRRVEHYGRIVDQVGVEEDS